MNTLDIRDFKDKGIDLVTLINQMVKDTQKVIMRTLPDKIIMTKNQFDDLAKVINMPDMFNSKERILVTKYNVMEIEIKDKRL